MVAAGLGGVDRPVQRVDGRLVVAGSLFDPAEGGQVQAGPAEEPEPLGGSGGARQGFRGVVEAVRWMTFLGYTAAARIATGIVIPLGIDVATTTNVVGYAAWCLWLIAMAIASGARGGRL
jgi:hypothetical protein